MRRGINLGNALDVDPGTATVAAIEEADLDVIAGAGFDTLRLPVRWSAHSADRSPFTIDERFARLADDAIVAALERGLDVIVDMHHAEDVTTRPDEQEHRFGALWAQIARRCAELPDRVAFELLNEPRTPMSAEQWNSLLRVGLDAVRRISPTRPVVVGTTEMGTIAGLAALDLPSDEHLIVTIHYYEPYRFTHQGAPWEPGSGAWMGTDWGTSADQLMVRTQLVAAASWAADRKVPLVLGEFGTYERASLDARVRWTRAVRQEAERLQLPWCYWDFSTDFGVYDRARRTWRTPLLDALLPASAAPG